MHAPAVQVAPEGQSFATRQPVTHLSVAGSQPYPGGHFVEVSTEKQADAGFEAPMGDPGLRNELAKAFAALPEAQREAVLLHKVHGLTFEQIAEAVGTSPTAARIRAHRGYERLRSLLGHLEES